MLSQSKGGALFNIFVNIRNSAGVGVLCPSVNTVTQFSLADVATFLRLIRTWKQLQITGFVLRIISSENLLEHQVYDTAEELKPQSQPTDRQKDQKDPLLVKMQLWNNHSL